MTTRETVQAYFDGLKRKNGWDPLLAEDLSFTSFTSPIKRVAGRAAYPEATRRFYSSVTDFEVRDMLVDGPKACVLTR